MTAPTLVLDGTRLRCGGTVIGEVKGVAGFQHLASPAGWWAFDGVEAFRARVAAHPDQAMNEVEVAFDDARQFAGFAASSLHRKDHEETKRDLTRVNEALAVAKAWRELAGYGVEVEP